MTQLDFKINHFATRDKPFPDDLKVGNILVCNQGILRLHNALFICNDEYGSSHWVMFFTSVDGRTGEPFTRLKAYQNYIADRPTAKQTSHWLSATQDPNAIVLNSSVGVTDTSHPGARRITYRPLKTDMWYTADTPMQELLRAPIQCVINKLWTRQHYYKTYIEGDIAL